MLKKETRFHMMLVLTGLMFLAELIVGYYTHSIALIADSFHMLSDVFALVIGWYAIILVKKKDAAPKWTYGLQRAEVVAALINGVLLLSLSFTIFIEALQRFVQPEVIESTDLVLYVGTAGLIVNILGLFLFHEHGHDHQHVEMSDFEPANVRQRIISTANELNLANSDLEIGAFGEPVPRESHEHNHAHNHDHHNHDHSHDYHGHGGHGHSHDMNMRGVFLHVLGDMLGSIGVIVTMLIIKFCSGDWRWYMDPLISVLITALIVNSTIPLVKSASTILLQATPAAIPIESVRESLMAIEGVLNIHELHVWQLSNTKNVASVHVSLLDPQEGGRPYMSLASDIKTTLHRYGIHSTTVQPEFVTAEQASLLPGGCNLPCVRSSCEQLTCCSDK
ncbi:cation efflux protein [Gorgonomyces haynaldii]|nr:cation efflux protein [Gorgonomyces haynaldii]